jgi:quercetin dioxygenase-like cupin family protein
MAHSGDVLIDPIHNQHIIFNKTAEDTNGELVEVEVFYTPAAEPPPAHFHPQQEEGFEVLAGSIHTRINGQDRVYHAGEHFRVLPGTPHCMWNDGEGETHLLWQTRPALHTDNFFEILWRLMQEGKTNKSGMPNLLQATVIMRHYRHEFRLVKPPLIIQNIVFTLLAPVGRILGYHATYSRKASGKALAEKQVS